MSDRLGTFSPKDRGDWKWNRPCRGERWRLPGVSDPVWCRGPIVLYLGMKAHDKGSTCVVDAMKCLWREGSQAWLVLAGPSSRSFEEYLEASDSKFDRLLNLDPVTGQEKRDLLAAASVVVHPSRVESFGLVYLEAWANAKPVIAADTAVMGELIESDRDGLLVPFGEPKPLALAIQQLLDNQEERETRGLQDQKKCLNQFTWDAILERIHPYFGEEEVGSQKIGDRREGEKGERMHSGRVSGDVL